MGQYLYVFEDGAAIQKNEISDEDIPSIADGYLYIFRWNPIEEAFELLDENKNWKSV